MPPWLLYPALMTRLRTAQQHPAHRFVDIMTFAGLCATRDELERHVFAAEGRVARHEGVAAVAAALGLPRQVPALAA